LRSKEKAYAGDGVGFFYEAFSGCRGITEAAGFLLSQERQAAGASRPA
jgi:hypothetical protein